MARIRLLADAPAGGTVAGRRGDVLVVDAATARAWADGERAERVTQRSAPVEAAVTRGGERRG